MRYALLIHYPQTPAITLSEETMKQGMAAFQAYAKALDDAGVLRSAEVLQTVANATSVSMKQGKLQVQDGPFADTKEAFAGIYTLDVTDLDAALAWAEKCPAAHWGAVEIRPSAGAIHRRRVGESGLTLALEHTMTTEHAKARAEEVARASYGRLLAILAAKDGDIESAEDCLAAAFAQALRRGPRAGVPDNPEAWILTVARNRRQDVRRSAAYQLTDSIDDVSRAGAVSAGGALRR